MMIESHFKTFHDFLQMGGYADYVWPAYTLVFIVLIANIITPYLRRLKLQRKKMDESAS